MAELKTKPSDQSVERYLGKIADQEQRKDCLKLLSLMQQITRAEPKLWGGAMVGFGTFRCRYASGRECDWFLTGFAPRKQKLSLYIMSGVEQHKALLEQLGPHSLGVSCLYIKRLSDIHLPTLKKLIRDSIKHARTPLERAPKK